MKPHVAAFVVLVSLAAALCLGPVAVHAQSSGEFVSVTDAMLRRPAR